MSSSENTRSLLNDEEVTPSEVVAEDQPITTEQLISMIDIKTQLPKIASNFDTIKAHVVAGLKEYEVTVTLENMAAAKKMATTLNQLSEKVDETRKNTVKIVSAPIDVFGAQCKELVSLIDEKRTFLLNQIEVFNARTRKECLSLLESALKTAYHKFDVKEEFQIAKVADLAIVSNKTNSGIKPAAKGSVEARALECKRFQEKVELRLNTLEGTCYKAGLEAPLVRQNIESFLKVDDEEIYQQKLQSMIKSEIKRFGELEQKLVEKAKKEAEVKAKAEFEAQQRLQTPTTVQIESNTQPEIIIAKAPISQTAHVQPSVKPTGNQKTYVVTAVFEVTTDESEEQKLAGYLLQKFEQAHIKNMPTITIVEKGVKKAPETEQDSRSKREEGSLF
ncbi:DUF1351 domain-containing protein [Sulfurospirillum multivorans]|nr:DUF1351 domain-containing protein [Sulfurospirillum multivorans]QEH06578.1 hypothetical protein SMN_1813 [Sulfurospirillum multivorans]